MSTDRELLELAAKAAGMEGMRYASPYMGMVKMIDPSRPNETGSIGPDWNPLTDDGDALRLLAALPSLWSLSLKFGSPSIVMDVAWGFKGSKVTKFNGQNTDRAEVIRRAIVEAAAQMQKENY